MGMEGFKKKLDKAKNIGLAALSGATLMAIAQSDKTPQKPEMPAQSQQQNQKNTLPPNILLPGTIIDQRSSGNNQPNIIAGGRVVVSEGVRPNVVRIEGQAAQDIQGVNPPLKSVHEMFDKDAPNLKDRAFPSAPPIQPPF